MFASLKLGVILMSVILISIPDVLATKHAKKLFEMMLTGYNRLVRPVHNTSDVVTVKLKLKLVQLLDVHEKNQIMTTNVWLTQEWVDGNFKWDPVNWGGVEFLHIPADQIWLPGIVLYNNADGQYQVPIVTKALVFYNGTILWEPPAIFHSMCAINIRWFPFDEQNCEMRFGSWTYDGHEVDVVHYEEKASKPQRMTDGTKLTRIEKGIDISSIYPSPEWDIMDIPSEKHPFATINWYLHYEDKGSKPQRMTDGTKLTRIEKGIDISSIYPSPEWDIMDIPSERHEVRYNCCSSPYVDVTFSLNLRRKTLYYTVNLIIPCAGISSLTVAVFYLPSDSGEKVGLCINILICLTWFFLLLVEIIPGTSLVIPLIGLYILFNMVIVTLSIIISVITLNVNYRSPDSHRLPKWARDFFTRWLPKILQMQRPIDRSGEYQKFAESQKRKIAKRRSTSAEIRSLIVRQASTSTSTSSGTVTPKLSLMQTLPVPRGSIFRRGSGRSNKSSVNYLDAVSCGVDEAQYVAEHFNLQTYDGDIKEDWRYIAQVLDRLFLWLFCLMGLTGTCLIILRAPVIYDSRVALV